MRIDYRENYGDVNTSSLSEFQKTDLKQITDFANTIADRVVLFQILSLFMLVSGVVCICIGFSCSFLSLTKPACDKKKSKLKIKKPKRI